MLNLSSPASLDRDSCDCTGVGKDLEHLGHEFLDIIHKDLPKLANQCPQGNVAKAEKYMREKLIEVSTLEFCNVHTGNRDIATSCKQLKKELNKANGILNKIYAALKHGCDCWC
ncbi:hypothetical protein L596_008933 [Steinernema carpocapsae]|uniref:Uncharacterized protein n=1 Tax=Steinernema carpocapsae TaxID=34508 RepID=A0A4U5PEF3_STECR|nr:hypothetical protein L596_008933 [Steinernema carpocapsae]